MNSDESQIGTLEKHYRVTLDFKMFVREITPEVCQESDFFKAKSVKTAEPELVESIERQKRLYSLLRQDGQILERYLLSVLTQEAGQIAYDKLTDAFNVSDETEFLVPLYQKMPQEDRRFFEECRDLGVLAENTDLISTAFQVEWTGVGIAEMNRVVEGDIKRAEVMEETKTRLIRKINSA